MLTTYRTPILPEWVDYNDHLRDAFYLLIFSYATDALMTRIGLDHAGRERSGHTLYTLECHLITWPRSSSVPRWRCTRSCWPTIASGCRSTTGFIGQGRSVCWQQTSKC